METMILLMMLFAGVAFFVMYIFLSTRRGEDCPGYPYNCACCRHAFECMMKIAEQNEREKKEMHR